MPVQKLSGSTLSYVEQGSGIPLVLLHGFPLDKRMYAGQIQQLSRICRVILPDLCGFGESKGNKPFTIRSLAHDVFELLTQIKALPCVLGGISMGGYVALAYQEEYPNTLRGLILIDTRAEPETPEGVIARNVSIENAKKGTSLIAEQMMPKLFAQGIQTDPALIADMKSMMENCPSLTMQHALAAMRDRDDFRPGLAHIVTSTLILVGESDTITPLKYSQNLYERIKGSRMKIIKRAGHMTPMEQPHEVNHAIDHFLRAINRPE